MHILRWNCYFRDQRLIGHRVVTVRVIWRNATFVTEKEIDVRPLDAMRKALSRKQFINSPGRITAGQGNAKPVRLAMKRIFVFDKPFSRGCRKLLRSVEDKNIGRNFHGRVVKKIFCLLLSDYRPLTTDR